MTTRLFMLSCLAWTRFQRRLAFAVLLMALTVTGNLVVARYAFAAMGFVDTENNFPYVVKIEMGNGSCSGVVTSDNLVTTAAHCVFDLDTKVLTDFRRVRVLFKDMYGAQKSVGVRKIFIPDSYRKVQPLRFSGMANHFEHVRTDIAILIPDEVIEVDGYAHWITELLAFPYSDYLDRCGTSGQKCPNTESELLQILTKELGLLSEVKTLIVGYGGFACQRFIKDDEGHDDCQRDNQRRFAEAPLVPSMQFEDAARGLPYAWCLGQNAEGYSPVRRGDSGGPLFVKAIDGRLLFAGYLSLGSQNWACSSSVLTHQDFFASVLASPENKSAPKERSLDWRGRQAARWARETFGAFSAPNKEAIARLRVIYNLSIDASGKLTGNFSGLRSRDENRINAYKEKERLFNLWPVRKFRIDRGTLQAHTELLRPRAIEGEWWFVEGVVSWEFSNPTTGASKSGRSGFAFTLVTSGIEGTQAIDGGYLPGLHEESQIDFVHDAAASSPKNTFKIYSDMTFLGGDYWNRKGLSFEQCEQACRLQETCKAFSFVDKSGWCWIKSAVPELSDRPGINSGLRIH